MQNQTNTELVPIFENVAKSLDLGTDKWTCPIHYSTLPGMYRKHETELAWKAFNAGYSLGKQTVQ